MIFLSFNIRNTGFLLSSTFTFEVVSVNSSNFPLCTLIFPFLVLVHIFLLLWFMILTWLIFLPNFVKIEGELNVKKEKGKERLRRITVRDTRIIEKYGEGVINLLIWLNECLEFPSGQFFQRARLAYKNFVQKLSWCAITKCKIIQKAYIIKNYF